ncbi:MAG: MFS transporter, partial [Dehalococcoidales bacterium]|nr:MFS transporter [Dehalococcoidales bacterium]
MPVTQSRKTNSAKSGFFYGYIIVASAFLILIAYSGARSAFGVFFNPMAAQFGWSAAALSTAFSISIIMDGSFGIVLGQLTDKIGPRLVLTLSGIFIGVGYLLLSRVSGIWQMYLLYGVVVGIGMGGG